MLFSRDLEGTMRHLAHPLVILCSLSACADNVPAAGGDDGSDIDEPTVFDDEPDAVEPFAPDAPSHIQHVFVIAMENHADSSIYGNSDAPFIQTLLAQGGRATNFVDKLPDDPSEPHYVWMEAGTNAFTDHTFDGDGDPSSSNNTSSKKHLTTQINTAGKTWMSYQEGLNTSTGACPVKSSGNYAAKHDPFIFFEDVSGTTPSKTNTYCADHHKALTALAADLAADTVATYNFITPNLCHDMHSNFCSGFTNPIKQGDTWLSENVPALVDYANAHAGVVFIVWDEPEGSTGHIPLIVVGPHVKANHASTTKFSHSSLVKTVELIMQLPQLATVTHSNSLRDFFETGFYP
jgi:phosphatidylinositol-3-phosphatase